MLVIGMDKKYDGKTNGDAGEDVDEDEVEFRR